MKYKHLLIASISLLLSLFVATSAIAADDPKADCQKKGDGWVWNDTSKTCTSTKLNCAILDQAICNAAVDPPKDGNVTNTGVFKLLVWVINILTAVVGVVAVGVLVYAGIMYASAGDNSQQVSSAKDMIKNTIIGIITYALMYFAVNWLIPGGVIG